MFRSFLLSIILVFGLAACCTKKLCDSIIDPAIYLEGFVEPDCDTVLVKSYAAGGAFNQLLDSTVFYPDRIGNSTTSSFQLLPLGIDRDKDYRIYFPSLGETYVLGGFAFARESCNNCPLRKDDYYEILVGYSVNGIARADNRIIINKE